MSGKLGQISMTETEHHAVASGTTVDPEEVAFFAKIADSWWDPHGPFKPLHQLNPEMTGM